MMTGERNITSLINGQTYKMKKEKINGLERKYTDTEIKSIRENFIKAFGTPYGLMNGNVKELSVKKDSIMNKFIKVGDYFYRLIYKQEAKELGLEEGYVRILITYRRSGVIFFNYPDSINPRKEFHFELGSEFCNKLIPLKIHYDRLSIKSQNRFLMQLNFSPRLAGKHIEVYDEDNNRLPDIIIGNDGYEIKDDI